MGYMYYDLRELFYGTPGLTMDVRKEIIQRIGPAGPFLRYKYTETQKSVKMKLTSRRAFTFDNVGGQMEIIYADGTITPVKGESIDLPLPYYPCSSEEWNMWKRFCRCSDRIFNIYTFTEGIVVLEYLWADCDVYIMRAYKDGHLFGQLKSPKRCDPGKRFYQEMMSSSTAEPFVIKLYEKYGTMHGYNYYPNR